MNGKHLHIASLFLTAAHVMPVAMVAATAPQRAASIFEFTIQATVA